MKKRDIIKPDPSLRSNLMAFGYECGKGWYPLIEKTLDKIEAALPPEMKDDFQVLQIKEKWGMLTIYTSSETEEIEKILKEATAESCKICEHCGNPANLVVEHGWYVTICPDCLNKMRDERKKYE